MPDIYIVTVGLTGSSGGWRNEFTQEQKDKFQAWIDKNAPEGFMDNFQ